jgi:hypothetical protein
MVKEVMRELVVAVVVTAINFFYVHGNYEAIYDIEGNTEKSVKFFKYFELYRILLPVLCMH